MKGFALLALATVARAVVDPSDRCGTIQNNIHFNLTISTQDDVKAVSSCTKIGCNLVIDKNFPGQAEFPNIRIVDGAIWAGDVDSFSSGGFDNVAIEQSELTGLSFPTLVKASLLQIVGLRDLQTLDFPAIKEVSREMDLISLPSLETWTGFETLNYTAYTHIINTGLSNIIWNSSDSRNPITGTIVISNNTSLDLVNLYNPLNVDHLEVNGNGNTKIGLGIETVRSLTITGCGGYADYNYGLGDGINELKNVTGLYTPDGLISIWNNTFQTIRFSFLSQINGSVEIHSNPNLVNVSMSGLWEIDGTFDITDNDALKAIKPSDFRNLETVTGSVNLTGAFDDIELSQRLNVTYGFEIRATGNVSCQQYDQAYKQGYFAYGSSTTRYGCAANGAPLVYQSHNGQSSSSSSSSSSNSHGLSRAAFLALVIAIPVPISLGFWIGLIWWLCIRHKRKKANKALNAPTMAVVPTQYGQGPAPVQYYGETPGNQAPPFQTMPERKPLATMGVHGVNDQASSLTVGDRTGLVSSHSSISRDSRAPGQLERREEELEARERMIEEMERERREEELNARERALAEREREIKAWDEQRRRASGTVP